MELKEIISKAEQAENLLVEIKNTEQTLKAQKAELRELVENSIPSMFVENGISNVTLSSGIYVGLKQIFAVNIPAAGAIAKAKEERKQELIDRLNKCVNWLRENQGAAIIQNSVTVSFSAGEDETAEKLLSELQERKLQASAAQSIHPGTLKSFLREKWNNDTEIPVELFETYTGQVAEFSLPKPEKSGQRSAKS